jgi:hypothetical protein
VTGVRWDEDGVTGCASVPWLRGDVVRARLAFAGVARAPGRRAWLSLVDWAGCAALAGKAQAPSVPRQWTSEHPWPPHRLRQAHLIAGGQRPGLSCLESDSPTALGLKRRSTGLDPGCLTKARDWSRWRTVPGCQCRACGRHLRLELGLRRLMDLGWMVRDRSHRQ